MLERDAMTKLCHYKMSGGFREGEALCEGSRCMAFEVILQRRDEPNPGKPKDPCEGYCSAIPPEFSM